MQFDDHQPLSNTSASDARYHDYANVTEDDDVSHGGGSTSNHSQGDSSSLTTGQDHHQQAQVQPEVPRNGGTDHSFPVRLHYMLGELERDGLDNIVSWQPHGRCFVVHKQQEFVDRILPLWFRQSKFASFQRQLNLYGFTRLTSGLDKGGYYHEYFLRGKDFLARRIQRQKIKGTGARKASAPGPDFYAKPYCLPGGGPCGPTTLTSSSSHSSLASSSSLSCMEQYRNAKNSSSEVAPRSPPAQVGVGATEMKPSTAAVPDVSRSTEPQANTATAAASVNPLLAQVLAATLLAQQPPAPTPQPQVLAPAVPPAMASLVPALLHSLAELKNQQLVANNNNNAAILALVQALTSGQPLEQAVALQVLMAHFQQQFQQQQQGFMTAQSQAWSSLVSAPGSSAAASASPLHSVPPCTPDASSANCSIPPEASALLALASSVPAIKTS